jgi:hypothetical protein
VTTKYDLLSIDEVSHAREALDEFEDRLTKSYAHRFGKFSVWRTAARDPNGIFAPAWGVAPLLTSWLAPPDAARRTPPVLPPLSDMFDLLLLRRSASA